MPYYQGREPEWLPRPLCYELPLAKLKSLVTNLCVLGPKFLHEKIDWGQTIPMTTVPILVGRLKFHPEGLVIPGPYALTSDRFRRPGALPAHAPFPLFPAHPPRDAEGGRDRFAPA